MLEALMKNVPQFLGFDETLKRNAILVVHFCTRVVMDRFTYIDVTVRNPKISKFLENKMLCYSINNIYRES